MPNSSAPSLEGSRTSANYRSKESGCWMSKQSQNQFKYGAQGRSPHVQGTTSRALIYPDLMIGVMSSLTYHMQGAFLDMFLLLLAPPNLSHPIQGPLNPAHANINWLQKLDKVRLLPFVKTGPCPARSFRIGYSVYRHLSLWFHQGAPEVQCTFPHLRTFRGLEPRISNHGRHLPVKAPGTVLENL